MEHMIILALKQWRYYFVSKEKALQPQHVSYIFIKEMIAQPSKKLAALYLSPLSQVSSPSVPRTRQVGRILTVLGF
jgi:hypothetical protein